MLSKQSDESLNMVMSASRTKPLTRAQRCSPAVYIDLPPDNQRAKVCCCLQRSRVTGLQEKCLSDRPWGLSSGNQACAVITSKYDGVLDYRPRAIFRLFLSCPRLSSSSIKRSCSSSSRLAILALKETNIKCESDTK